jgi:poly(3-hydroxybutyrate) depolymerase
VAPREGNVAFFEQVRETVLDEFCIDEGRVFVAGTSSGAHFANVLGCRFGDELLAVAPVAGYLPESMGCQGTPAALVIHGVDDPHVTLSSGIAARDFWAGRNGCSAATQPPLADMHQDIRNKRDAMPTVEDHGCVDYQGCDHSPVRWCEHSYGGYDDSTHGWPPNGGQLIWDFVQTLP